MKWLVYHVVSGQAFFAGIALIVFAALSSTQTKPIYLRCAILSFLIGLIAVVVSSTAIPFWFYGVGAVTILSWFASFYWSEWRRWSALAVVGFCLVAVLLELPFHFMSPPRLSSDRSITIIGDSITAGIDAGESSKTWPNLLANEHQLQLQDISHVGDNVALALKRAKSHRIQSSLVIVEIGGNDMLGATTAEDFGENLDQLLTYLTAKDRQIIMFELPLPPLYHLYGRAQRTLAAKHHVLLIPKRELVSILADPESTSDTIHLTALGHQRMAERVWQLIKLAYEAPAS